MVNPICSPNEGFGPSLSETSMGGMTTMLRSAAVSLSVVRFDVCWRMCEVVVEESVVTTKMVTSKAW